MLWIYEENSLFTAITHANHNSYQKKYKDIAKHPILKNQPSLKLNDKSQSTDKVPLIDIVGMS